MSVPICQGDENLGDAHARIIDASFDLTPLDWPNSLGANWLLAVRVDIHQARPPSLVAEVLS